MFKLTLTTEHGVVLDQWTLMHDKESEDEWRYLADKPMSKLEGEALGEEIAHQVNLARGLISS